MYSVTLLHLLQLIKNDQVLLRKYFECISLKLGGLEFRRQQILKMGSKILELFFQDLISPDNLLSLVHLGHLMHGNKNRFVISGALLYFQV